MFRALARTIKKGKTIGKRTWCFFFLFFSWTVASLHEHDRTFMSTFLSRTTCETDILFYVGRLHTLPGVWWNSSIPTFPPFLVLQQLNRVSLFKGPYLFLPRTKLYSTQNQCSQLTQLPVILLRYRPTLLQHRSFVASSTHLQATIPR